MIIKKNKQQNLHKEKSSKISEQNEVNDNLVQEALEEEAVEIEQTVEETIIEPKIDLFDIENIDFTQRQERRRGSRRRGYRRIDDRNLVSRAQEESENIKKSAFEEGYRLGLEKASEDLDVFRKELSNFMNAKQDVFEYIAPDILEISVDIAKKIIKKEVESDPQVLINTIVDVLRTVSKNEAKINIRVHPQSVQIIKDTIPNIIYQYGIDSKINVISDPSITEGGCVFQTSNGIVDASIDTQMEIIKKALQGIV
jgi:flagellar assembly protein FliH